RLCRSAHGVHRVSFDRRTPAMAMGILADSDCLPIRVAPRTRGGTASIRTDDTRRAHLVRHPARRDRGGAGPNRAGDDPRLSALRGLGIVKSPRLINPGNLLKKPETAAQSDSKASGISVSACSQLCQTETCPSTGSRPGCEPCPQAA